MPQQMYFVRQDKLYLPLCGAQVIVMVSFVSYQAANDESSEDDLFCCDRSVSKQKSV